MESSRPGDQRISGLRVGATFAFIGLGLVCTVLFVMDHAWSLYDDAYIYLRYAANILDGHGPRWNIADAPVEGFTGPAWLLLLVLCSLFSVDLDLETLTQLLGLLMIVWTISLAAWTAGALAAQRSDQDGDPKAGHLPFVVAGAATCLLLSFDHLVLLNSVIGLETGLAAFLVTAILASVTVWQNRGLRILIVLAVLTRPEAALFGLLVPLLPQGRKFRWLLPAAGAAVVMELLRWFIFGDLVPNTFHAKIGGTAAHARLGLEYIGIAIREFPAIVLAPLSLFLLRSRAALRYFLLVALLWFAYFLRTGGDFFPFSRLAFRWSPR